MGLRDTLSKAKAKAVDQIDDLQGKFSMAKVQVETTFNPNHRHDEAHEKEADAQLAAICASHRFNSFAQERHGSNAKFYIDGHDFFAAAADLIDSAKEFIGIFDWWLSPELYLKRPPAENEEWRLDRLLLKKAQQGVKICIVVYKEVTQSMTMSSAATKHTLEYLHENISVMRHPDHLGGEVTLLWSHHEKVILVDNAAACIGGLDLCFGRWDTHTAPLCDAHPKDISATLFPCADFNNARISDFAEVDHWLMQQPSRLDSARMPWHDVHTMVSGPVVMDIAQHFVERYNYVRHLKYSHDHRYPLLAFPHVIDENNELAAQQEPVLKHPRFHDFKEGIKFFRAHANPPPTGHEPHGGKTIYPEGQMRIQVLRSSADWSHGILTEHSIQNAYRQMIAEASDFVYIENQFFVTSVGKATNGPVLNVIGEAIAERCLLAAKDGKKFKVMIVIPAIPGFAGDLKASGGTLAIIASTIKSVQAIFKRIKDGGFEPSDYIGLYNLRSYDRLPDPELIKRQVQASGYTHDQVQAALGRIYMGDNATKRENEKNPYIQIHRATETGENLADGEGKKDIKPSEDRVPIPATVAEARDIISAFERAYPQDARAIPDSVAGCATVSRQLIDMPWTGTPEDEARSWITEEKYIHSKLLIVDDRRVLIGSANLNDRSQMGDRDSEIAIVIEDNKMVESRMNGKKFMAARFASQFRRQLFKLHLGLAEEQICEPGNSRKSSAMTMLSEGGQEIFDQEHDETVMDPLSDEFQNLWKSRAKRNTEIFEDVFHVVPTDRVTTWTEYQSWKPKAPTKPGHIADYNMDPLHVKQQLNDIKGSLVEMPLHFLEKEELIKWTVDVNPGTMAVYI